MKQIKQRRNLFDKERFAEGNRQKWCGIFTAIGIVVMVATSYGWLKNPEPFSQFFLSIGVTFILGASASAVMNSWKVSSATVNQNVEEHRREERREEITLSSPWRDKLRDYVNY